MKYKIDELWDILTHKMLSMLIPRANHYFRLPNKPCSNVIQNLVLHVSGNLDNKPITILIDTGSSTSLLDELLYCWLSSIPPLQPIPFFVSGADDQPLIAQGKIFISIAIYDDTIPVQLVVTRNILLPVVLGIDFLQTRGGVINFPTNQLYLTNPSPKPIESLINTNHTHNPYTPSMHTPSTYHPHPCTSTQPNQPYHIISNEPVTITPRANTLMTIPCALSCSRNYLFQPSGQHFVGQPVHYTPVIINAENYNLPVRFINHSDQEIVILKHSYVGALEKFQNSDLDMCHADTSPEPVNQHALSECLVQSDLLPNQRQQLYNVLQENSGVFRSSTADLTSTPHCPTL